VNVTVEQAQSNLTEQDLVEQADVLSDRRNELIVKTDRLSEEIGSFKKDLETRILEVEQPFRVDRVLTGTQGTSRPPISFYLF